MRGGGFVDPAPLLEWLDRNPDAVAGWQSDNSGPRATTMKSINRIRNGERVTFLQMDKLCCQLGEHMLTVGFPQDVYFNTPLVDPRGESYRAWRLRNPEAYARKLRETAARKRQRRAAREAA